MTIVWQSALPPTLCSISIVIIYLATHHFVPVRLFPICAMSLGHLSRVPCCASADKTNHFRTEAEATVVSNAPSDYREAIYSLAIFQPVRHICLWHLPCSLKFHDGDAIYTAIPVHYLVAKDRREAQTFQRSRYLQSIGQA